MSASNIKAVTKTADASAVVGRCRLYGIYFTNSATASSFDLKKRHNFRRHSAGKYYNASCNWWATTFYP